MTDTSPHVLVTENDDAGREVAEQSDQEVDGVDDGERYENTQLFVGVTEMEFNKFSF